MIVTKHCGVAVHLWLTWLLVIVVPSITDQQARVTIPPKPVNAGLNETVSFTCTAIGEQIRWRVNRATITPDLRSRGFDDSSAPVTLNATQHLQTSTLTVFGSVDNNGTNITCVAIFLISSISSDESEAALLLVFEPDSQKVNNLTVTLINSTTVLISWSPPFTLEGVPILGYNVTITNTTSGENETMLVEDTTLLYSIDHPDPENNFTVTVVPINVVGAGQPLNSEPFLFPSPESTTVQPSQIVHESLISILMSMHMPVETSSLQQLRTTAQYNSAFDTMTSTMVPLVITTDSSVVVPALITVNVATVVIILSLVVAIVFIVWCCVIKIRKIKRTATKQHALDEVPVRDNPAYQLVSLHKSHHESPSTSVQQATPPTHQASPQYENIMEVDEKCGGDDNEHDYEN